MYQLQFLKNSPAWLTHHILLFLNHCDENFTHWSNAIALIPNPLIQAINHLVWLIAKINLSRLAIFILALPLISVLLLVFLVDGLVKRDIRKFQGARESTLTFHRNKRAVGFFFFLSFFIYLSLPFAFPPLLFIALQIAVLGIPLNLTATYFKKYL